MCHAEWSCATHASPEGSLGLGVSPGAPDHVLVVLTAKALSAPEPDPVSLRASSPVLRTDIRKNRSATISSANHMRGRGLFSSWAEAVQVVAFT